MTADEIFKKMGKTNIARKELMHQMKLYRSREKPFDIELGATEHPTTWWVSMEDCFSKGEDYLVQLALKLLSVTPHAAGCERVYPDEDLIEFIDDDNDTEIRSIFDEEDSLKISDVLNLDAEEFIKDLDEIIEDSLEEIDDDIQDILEPEVTSDIDWDPATEIDNIVDDM